VLGWLATTALSMALGWVALLPVTRAATPDEGAALQLPSTGPLPSTAQARPESALESAGPGTTTGAPSGSPRTKPTASPTSGTPRTDPSKSPTATVNGWSASTGADGKPVYLRSFRVAGGQAVIRITGGRVELVGATPAEGWKADSVQNQPEDLAVFFTKPEHGLTIHAIWWNDQPYAQVSGQ
jgi:hypothetical protein